jgi:hypothetical protein
MDPKIKLFNEIFFSDLSDRIEKSKLHSRRKLQKTEKWYVHVKCKMSM